MVPKLKDRYKNVIHARTLLIRQHFSLLFCKNLLISCSTCRAFIPHAHILYIVKNYSSSIEGGIIDVTERIHELTFLFSCRSVLGD